MAQPLATRRAQLLLLEPITPRKIGEIAKNLDVLDFFLYGRWEDLDRWKWVVIDVGVILDTSASHSENFLFRHFSTFFDISTVTFLT